MSYEIRHILPSEQPLLEDFLLEAIFVPEGYNGAVPRSIIFDDPMCAAAHVGFGSRPDDRALIACIDKVPVGACWVRTTNEYGHIDDMTPSFAISILKPYRGQGIGTKMLHQMLCELLSAGYERASLSVQKQNQALRLYERMGFRIVGDGFDESEWLMVCHFDDMRELEMRPLRTDDLPTFVELRIAQLLEEGACETHDLRPALYDFLLRHLSDGSFVSMVAVDQGRIVGTSGLSLVEKPPYFSCPSGRIGLVSCMYTIPSYRRAGIARDLFCRVMDVGFKRGCDVLQVTASAMGVSLCESVGFTRHDRFLQLTR